MDLYDILVSRALSGSGGGGGGGDDDDFFFKATRINQETTGFLRVVFGNHATKIPGNTLQWSSQVKEIVIGNATTRLEYDCLKQMSSLESVIIGENVEYIGQQAFYSDSKLASITINRAIPPQLVNTNAFSGISSNYVIYVPSGSVQTYKSATTWSSIASHIQAIQ